MPVLSWAHQAYWAGPHASEPEPGVGSSAGGAYVPWQTSVISVMSLALAVRWAVSR
jgi:hypothetical protein